MNKNPLRKHNACLTPRAKSLRKNMTKEERKLWYLFLRNYPLRFIRQKVIGNYIVDFYCSKAKLAIEIDGEHHYFTENYKKDAFRAEQIEKFGVDVIRFGNYEINKEFRAVCDAIDLEIKSRIRE